MLAGFISRILRPVIVAAFAASLATPASTMAGGLMDYIRAYDLNDYALGVAVTGSQSPYTGAKAGVYAYPYLTSFRHSAFTDDWLLVRDGDVGLRWVSDGGWELGAVGRVKTGGLGADPPEALRGLDERRWTLEFGPTIGWRGWPVHINLKAYAEILDRHEGYIGELAFSLPREGESGYFVPSFELLRMSDDYTGYYYGVTEGEVTPSRPAYSPGAATSARVKLRYGYRLSDKWLLSGYVAVESLGDELRDSPIVDRDHLWSMNLGLAYNADVFRPRDYPYDEDAEPAFEFRLGAFHDTISTTIRRDSDDGSVGDEIDLEDVLGVNDDAVSLQVDAFYRVGRYHRLELGYFELNRHSMVTLQNDLSIGNLELAAGTDVTTRMKSEILRLSYGYSLMKDPQKELGVMAGVHYSVARAGFSTDTGDTASSHVTTPLPVVGAFGSVALGETMRLGAKVQAFAMDFDRYEGLLNYATIDLQRSLGQSFSAGVAYTYYYMKLTSSIEDLQGSLNIRHHGPTLFLSARF